MALRGGWYRRRRGRHPWLVALIVVVSLSFWGFTHLPSRINPGQTYALPPLQVLYRTLKLFTLDLDVPPEAVTSAPVWIAAFAAPVLTLRGIAELFRDQLSGLLVQLLVRPHLVIFGANDRSAALLSHAERPGRWRKAIVIVDPNRIALATVTAPRVWKVLGTGTTATSLRRAAVHHADNVVIITSDNAQNSAITTHVLDLAPRRPPEVYVEVEEPGLARTLEQGGHRTGIHTTTFSAAALGAAAVIETLEAKNFPRGVTSLLAADDETPASIVLFGTGALVDAMVLELHRRRQVQLLDEPPLVAPVPRILLLGPDAEERRRALATLLGTDLTLIDLECMDVGLEQVVELDLETARHLSRYRPLRQVLVLTPSDFVGGGIAITLARHLGPDARLALITESASTPFGDEIQRQSAESPVAAPVMLFQVPDQAYDLKRLQAERVVDRLARAFHAAESATSSRGRRTSWLTLSPAERQAIRSRAEQQVKTATATGVPLRRSALVTLRPPELIVLEALGYDRPTALARAGLSVDFQSVITYVVAGRELLARQDPRAFAVWCEAARLQTEPAGIAATTPEGPEGSELRDVAKLLLLRRAALGDPDARLAVTSGVQSGAEGPQIVLIAGPSDLGSQPVDLLEAALQGRDPNLEIWVTPDTAAVVGDVAERAAVSLGAVSAHDGGRACLGLWQAIISAGHDPTTVRVLVLPGASADDVVTARALGAVIGRIHATNTPDLQRTLLNGGIGIVPLPLDRMTLRSFLQPARWPAALAAVRIPMARELHSRYVIRQRGRKPKDDPVLRPWAELSPWLQRSNLAVVDDIPNKLAALGLELDLVRSSGDGHRPASLADWQATLEHHMERLAELEHGRFTAERLLSGWASGVRDPERFMTPHLVPWDDLDEETKDYDREVVRDLPSVLALHGVRVRPSGS